MILLGVAEYRGFSERTTDNGTYKLLRFEDNLGESISFYYGRNSHLSIAPENLVKGTDYLLKTEYHRNDYQNRMQNDLVDVKSCEDETVDYFTELWN